MGFPWARRTGWRVLNVVIFQFPPNCLDHAHAKPFLMSRDAQKRAQARANMLMQEMPLYELPQARQLSQEELEITAKFPQGVMKIKQFEEIKQGKPQRHKPQVQAFT